LAIVVINLCSIGLGGLIVSIVLVILLYNITDIFYIV
jgi:hypothetical protein